MTRVILLALAAAGLAAPALAAPDWSKAPKKTIIVFYPGVASMEWALVNPSTAARVACARARPAPAAMTRKPR
ncbi:MAG: hypothetical protein IPO57_07135 [Rhodocyclales bacterium]|nr:hypothetical protein [Rhodocyclales bacterium]